MTAVFLLMTFQALVGGVDNLWHHELEAKLPQRASARRELALHAAREAIYGVVFLGLAWARWHGAFALLLAALLAAEVAITLADFLEEDRTRTLPPLERVLHTLLAVSYGLFLAALAPRLWAWGRAPSALVAVSYGLVSPLFSLFAAGLFAWSLRNLAAAVALGRAAPPAAVADRGHHIAPAVLVTGATGFVGGALVASLREQGRRVIVLSRDLRQARAAFGDGVWVVDRLAAIPSETRVEAVVNLAGARVLGTRGRPRGGARCWRAASA